MATNTDGREHSSGPEKIQEQSIEWLIRAGERVEHDVRLNEAAQKIKIEPVLVMDVESLNELLDQFSKVANSGRLDRGLKLAWLEHMFIIIVEDGLADRVEDGWFDNKGLDGCYMEKPETTGEQSSQVIDGLMLKALEKNATDFARKFLDAETDQKKLEVMRQCFVLFDQKSKTPAVQGQLNETEIQHLDQNPNTGAVGTRFIFPKEGMTDAELGVQTDMRFLLLNPKKTTRPI